jgi:hypothetical protein
MTARSVLLMIGAACLAGCAETHGYNGAFADKAAISGNMHRFAADTAQTFRAVAGTLVQRGFTIEQTDGNMGLIKASRNLADPKNPKIAYHISATAYIMAAPDSSGSTVVLSASQQTVLYRETHHWTGIIGPLAIPTRKEYQSFVTGEGSITDRSFYTDFFSALEGGLLASGAGAVLTSVADKPAAAAPAPPAQAARP